MVDGINVQLLHQRNCTLVRCGGSGLGFYCGISPWLTDFVPFSLFTCRDQRDGMSGAKEYQAGPMGWVWVPVSPLLSAPGQCFM